MTVSWADYKFSVYQHGGNWTAVGGLYIFAGLNSEQLWYPYYIGQTKSFAERIPTHENWQEAALLGATHVHAMGEQDQNKRLEIERQLIGSWQPILNA